MTRAQRLLALLQLLRNHRYPVTGARLAGELGISRRTLYRDIATLQQQGAPIEGEAGMGYVLKPGFTLPPLMFSADEIEALVLGARWVSHCGDDYLAAAARSALGKITAVLPDDLRHTLDATTLLIGPSPARAAGGADIAVLRRAIRTQHKLTFAYRDAQGETSARTVWPFALGFFDNMRLLVAWCELRGDFRNFRTDRIENLLVAEQRYARPRQALLREWREREGIAPQ